MRISVLGRPERTILSTFRSKTNLKHCELLEAGDITGGSQAHYIWALLTIIDEKNFRVTFTAKKDILPPTQGFP